MKKLLGIVVLGLLLVGCSTTSSVVSTDKLKQDMTKSELNELFLMMMPYSDPFVYGAGSEFYSDINKEIIWGADKSLFYVFRGVSQPVDCGIIMCNKQGNGTLESWHYTLNDARESISKPTTKALTKKNDEPLNGKSAFTEAALSIDAVLSAKFVSDSSFFMVVDYVFGMDWNQVAEYMCGGRSRYGLGSTYFGITVFNTNKSKVGKAYCK